MADYSTGQVGIADLIASHYTTSYEGNGFQSGNNKHLCAIKWKKTLTTYWLTIISPSTSYTYNSGNVETNINDYLNNNRCNSYLYWKRVYDDVLRYPDFPITQNERPAHNIETISMFSGNEDTKWLVECNIPIFTIETNEDFGKINRYKDTGDDSEADNYNSLHPKTLTINVKIDGTTYPNFFISSQLTDGDGEVLNEDISFNCKNGGARFIDVDWHDTSDKTLNVNTHDTFTYGEMYNDYNYGISSFRCTDILPDGSQDSDPVRFRWLKNTFVVDKAESYDGHLILNVSSGAPTEDDYPEDDPKWEDTDSSNTFSGANKLTTTYRLTDPQLNTLGNFLWSSTFKDNVLSLTNYPMENLIALKAMPFVVGTDDKEIKIGNVATGITAKKVDNSDNVEYTIGSAFIPMTFNNFIDFSDVNLQIYLPFIGFKELDNIVCMNRTLRVKYIFDCIYGNCLAILEVKDKDGNWLQYQCYQGTCGIDISVVSTNRANIENGYITSGLDAISDAMNGNIIGIAKDVFNGMTQDFHTQSNGVGNPSLLNRMKNSVYIIVRRPKKYSPNKEKYGHTYGYPCYKFKNLSELTGFTQVENFRTNGLAITDEERNMLISKMKEGVYL